MLTPDLASDFPEARYLMFWAMHVLIVWAAFHLVVGLHLLPTWATYWRTVGITAVWAVALMVYNTVADTNYGYLNGKPDSASSSTCSGPGACTSPPRSPSSWRSGRCSPGRGPGLKRVGRRATLKA